MTPDQKALHAELAATIASDLKTEFAAEIAAGWKITPDVLRRVTAATQASVASLADCDPIEVEVDAARGEVKITRMER
jgi:hypothetical protein